MVAEDGPHLVIAAARAGPGFPAFPQPEAESGGLDDVGQVGAASSYPCTLFLDAGAEVGEIFGDAGQTAPDGDLTQTVFDVGGDGDEDPAGGQVAHQGR